MPIVSVIMPVYNGEKYLRPAIDSILNQTLEDLELIIINDGSTDKSSEIVNSYSDKRIRFFDNKTNAMVAEVTNQGFLLSQGKYIALMDADDISYPQRLERQVQFLESNVEIGLCGTWSKKMGSDLVYTYPTDPEILKVDMLLYSPLRNPTIMLRRDLMFKYQLFNDLTYLYTQDFELFSRCIRHFPITNLPEVLLDYRVHEAQTSTKHDHLIKQNVNLIRINQLKFFLKIAITKEEEELHKLIMNDELLINTESLEREDKWLDKLINSNLKVRAYKEPHFSRTINSLRFRYKEFVNIKKYNWEVFMRFYFSPLPHYKYFSFTFQIIFIIKCLIFWKTRIR